MSTQDKPQKSAEQQAIDDVKRYYGEVLSSSDDLKTSACCSAEAMPRHVRPLVSNIHPEVLDRFYGCGSPFPVHLKGRTVLDLGCGTGRDVYLLSQLVGEEGRVIGVDMTKEQLDVARAHQEYHRERFGHARSNVTLVEGYIEDLSGAGVEAESVDLVVSNCVTNLSPNKPKLFAEVWRALKPGGELYFSDVFVDRRLPVELSRDPVLLGECLGAAMYVEDFRRLMASLGCADVRRVSTLELEITDQEIADKVGHARFYSITFRAFKLSLEDQCEDFGQVAIYQGTIPEAPHGFMLDDHHYFETGRPMLVCGNSADMISQTAYRAHFKLIGDKSVHYGLFDCSGGGSSGGEGSCEGGACC
jgi:arsenite methyltransferase